MSCCLVTNRAEMDTWLIQNTPQLVSEPAQLISEKLGMNKKKKKEKKTNQYRYEKAKVENDQYHFTGFKVLFGLCQSTLRIL